MNILSFEATCMTKHLWLDHIADHNMRNNWTVIEQLTTVWFVFEKFLLKNYMTSEKSYTHTQRQHTMNLMETSRNMNGLVLFDFFYSWFGQYRLPKIDSNEYLMCAFTCVLDLQTLGKIRMIWMLSSLPLDWWTKLRTFFRSTWNMTIRVYLIDSH